MKCLGAVDVDMSSVGERVELMLECVLVPSSSDLGMLGSSVFSSVVFGLIVLGSVWWCLVWLWWGVGWVGGVGGGGGCVGCFLCGLVVA